MWQTGRVPTAQNQRRTPPMMASRTQNVQRVWGRSTSLKTCTALGETPAAYCWKTKMHSVTDPWSQKLVMCEYCYVPLLRCYKGVLFIVCSYLFFRLLICFRFSGLNFEQQILRGSIQILSILTSSILQVKFVWNEVMEATNYAYYILGLVSLLNFFIWMLYFFGSATLFNCLANWHSEGWTCPFTQHFSHAPLQMAFIFPLDVSMVNRDKQIIMGVLLSFFLLAILIIVICMSVR